MPASSEHAIEGAATLPASVALHARPAGLFVRRAATFAANGKVANAKSILEVLALGATGGTEIVLAASGEDAAEAIASLAELVADLA